ncbi:MAG: hypothetical protein PHG24_01940 [Candidatus Pacebacteria bacterium]|nr:hypothetical protein [Candidatus Paceibacterota bacterium]
MEQDITYYTNLILSNEVQTLIDPYRNAAILISIFFIVISLVMIFKERFFVNDIVRRISDFFSDPRKNKVPHKFNKLWEKITYFYEKEDYAEMIKTLDYLMYKVLRWFGYAGNNGAFIMDMYGIREEAFPNIENVKRIFKLKECLKCTELKKEEMVEVYNLAKDTLIKTGIIK